MQASVSYTHLDVYKRQVAQYPQFQTAIDQLHDSKPQYAGALLSVFPEARQIVETEIENMINENETPEKAVESMASQINSSIEDYNLDVYKRQVVGFTEGKV